MTILDLRIFPDPVLKQKATPVVAFDSNLKTLLKNMAETMYYEKGVGLAAPQVGITHRLVTIDVSEERTDLKLLVNPEIIKKQGKCSGEEGCLSIPGYRDVVERSEIITVKAQDPDGEVIEFEASGLLSVCIQHEIDHLDGVLFIDRLSRLKKELFKKWLKKQIEDR